MTPTNIQDEFNARTLKTVKQAQEYAVDALKAVGERVQPLLPKTAVERIPGIENLPTATEVIEKAFALSAELLKSAKAVALEASKAFALRDGKKAAKPVAKKATPAATATADAAS
jgi:hypothetical protein